MPFFLLQKALWESAAETGIHMSCLFETLVQNTLHLFPDGPAIGFDDHASPHRRVLCQPALQHQVIVPLAVIYLLLVIFSAIS